MLFKPAFITAFLTAVALAAPSPSGHVLHEKRDAPLARWIKKGPVDAREVLPMRIGLLSSNLDNAEELLMEVAHHESEKYSSWYTAEEVVDIFAPPQHAVDSVREWLEASGIHGSRISQSSNKQWIQFDALSGEVDGLLKTKFHSYEHKATGKINIACDEYHLPAHISKVVDYITPGLKLLSTARVTDGKNELELEPRGFRSSSKNGFGGPLLKGPGPDLAGFSTPQLLSMCDTVITPACIATMYNITPATSPAVKGNQLGIFEEGDYLSQTDLSEFLALFGNGIPTTTTPKLNGVDGGTIPGPTPGAESDLDFQISIPIIYPQGTVLFQNDDLPYATGLQPGNDGAFNTFLDAIDGSYCTYQGGDAPEDPKYPDPNPAGYQGQRQCGIYKPTNVISISYGLQEPDLPTSYLQRQCNEYLKLGMQGVTVVYASGDSGVAARGEDAGNADGCLGTGQVFNPDFPSSCPWITSVGGTVLTGDVNKDEETAVTRFPSGGGFSNVFPRPSYQNSAVQNYFAFEKTKTNYPYYTLNTPTNNPSKSQYGTGIYNRAGRGSPDISAVADNVLIINAGAPTLIGGTSAAAPVVASIFTRINEERLRAGKKTIGFVNSILYANPSAFHDITVGNNSGCGTDGFYAAKGWDPVTGLGTPNYPKLLSVFMALK